MGMPRQHARSFMPEGRYATLRHDLVQNHAVPSHHRLLRKEACSEQAQLRKDAKNLDALAPPVSGQGAALLQCVDAGFFWSPHLVQCHATLVCVLSQKELPVSTKMFSKDLQNVSAASTSSSLCKSNLSTQRLRMEEDSSCRGRCRSRPRSQHHS